MALYEQPSCPKCNHEFDDEQLWHDGSGCNFPKNADETNQFCCPNCDAVLEVTYNPMPHWDFEDVEIEDGEQ